MAAGPLLPDRRGVDVPGRRLDASGSTRRAGSRSPRRASCSPTAAAGWSAAATTRSPPGGCARCGARIAGVDVTVWGARGGLERVLRIARKRLPAARGAVRPLRLAGPADRRHARRVHGAHRADHDLAAGLRGHARARARVVVRADLATTRREAPWLDEAFASYAEEAAGAQQRRWCRRPGRGPARHARHRVLPRARLRRRTGASTSRAPACSTCCATGWAARASSAALRDVRASPTATAGRRRAEFRAAMDAASPVAARRPLAPLPRRLSVSGARRASRPPASSTHTSSPITARPVAPKCRHRRGGGDRAVARVQRDEPGRLARRVTKFHHEAGAVVRGVDPLAERALPDASRPCGRPAGPRARRRSPPGGRRRAHRTTGCRRAAGRRRPCARAR